MSNTVSNTVPETKLLYLNGRFVDPGGPPIEVINPSTGEICGRIATLGRDGVRQAIEDAWAAFDGWRARTALERGGYLRKIADGIETRAAEIAATITRENGKPLPQSKGEVAMTIDHLRWFAEEGRRAYGRVVPEQAPGKRHLVFRTPVGPVGAIAPWNFPLVLAMRKAAPALAAGCPVILKPASATPLSAVILAEVVDACGLPGGVFQLVAGRASEISAEMMENPHCRKITFTGSTEVGRELMRTGAPFIKKLSLELGGHAPLLVFDDADLEAAVAGTLIAKFRNTGQSCIATNRVYVQEGVFETFVELLVEKAKALPVGDGFVEGVEIGPLIDEAALKTAIEHVEQAVAAGATLCCGGKRWRGEGEAGEKGFFLEPTILTGVPDRARCMIEETFAPVAPVVSFSTEDEVIARANASEFGLAAYVFTRDVGRVWRLGEKLEAGTIGINDAVPATSNCPFGGVKQSGLGRELGWEGLDAFLETKHLSFAGID